CFFCHFECKGHNLCCFIRDNYWTTFAMLNFINITIFVCNKPKRFQIFNPLLGQRKCLFSLIAICKKCKCSLQKNLKTSVSIAFHLYLNRLPYLLPYILSLKAKRTFSLCFHLPSLSNFVNT